MINFDCIKKKYTIPFNLKYHNFHTSTSEKDLN